MERHLSLMVPGAAATGRYIDVFAPFNHERIARVEAADTAVVEQALSTAAALHADRSGWLPVPERIAILDRLATAMQAEAEDLAREAALEGGKPLIDSRIEVARAIDGIRLCIETLRTQAGQVIPMGINTASLGRTAFTMHEPIGVVVAISAFNHPLNLIVHQVAPAVAVGCPVIVKPAEDTPLSCFRFVEMLRKAGLPDIWCQALVVDELAVAEALVTDPRVGFLSFIGSARVGWMLRSRLAPGARCALEHGGVAPVIVAPDADLDDAVPKLVKGGFYHAGQVCVSVQRVFAHASIARELAQRIADAASRLVVGDPTIEATEVGPLIRPTEVDRVDQWVREAVEAGAGLLCGGQRISDTCYQPTVLLNPPADAKVSTQEVFGPVVCAYEWDDIDKAIEQANALPYAFQAAVFSTNIDTALHAYRHLAASAVMVNDHTAFRVDWMPFAGLRQSGLGVGGIPYTMHDMQIEKMIVF